MAWDVYLATGQAGCTCGRYGTAARGGRSAGRSPITFRADLVERALPNAYVLRDHLPEQVVFYADRVYTSARIPDLCADLGLLQSVGRTGVGWDNATPESLWSTSETGLYNRRDWPTKAEARMRWAAGSKSGSTVVDGTPRSAW